MTAKNNNGKNNRRRLPDDNKGTSNGKEPKQIPAG
jgi:hypothetical protein